jgi:hypothetical protein
MLVLPKRRNRDQQSNSNRSSASWRDNYRRPCDVAVGHRADQSFAPRATAPESHQAGAGSGLVDEHQSGGIKQTLLANPARRARATFARSCSIARKLFLTVTLCRSKNRQTAVRLPGIRCLRCRNDLV